MLLGRLEQDDNDRKQVTMVDRIGGPGANRFFFVAPGQSEVTKDTVT